MRDSAQAGSVGTGGALAMQSWQLPVGRRERRGRKAEGVFYYRPSLRLFVQSAAAHSQPESAEFQKSAGELAECGAEERHSAKKQVIVQSYCHWRP